MAKKKNSAAVSLGRKGGKKRWEGMTKAEIRAEMRKIAKNPRPGRKAPKEEA